ncbi:MAG: Adenosylmethionine-8-amino-7-oxononanoate aminotransferase (EC [uncultured Campylobacterales bacterium]|uniref:Adenosylmethionine-8-amino-7-oxononanoate aminotransferase n=1 Tax=uncultured Campylobacterales bacterium TaxID=352960 RepID=A0A6S6SCM6_9BACT|nr:MAG: Adenosylmethionine-8-amino-7-oxononanoate aminotransferase (EC [uncultured Campylobacterales bacterium]
MNIDNNHIWHPYNSLPSKTPILNVASTNKCTITLKDGRELVDGMSSWWSAIHGYNNQYLDDALKKQIDEMPHIMFGGLTHDPSIKLTKKLLKILPKGLEKVFYADSGSVSIEVALKTALLYQKARNKPNKKRFLSVFGGYHGDTLGAMSICDPINSMHSLYREYLPQNIFAKMPSINNDSDDIEDLEEKFQNYHEEIAGFIIEPIVQGAGGMRIYRPQYLKRARELCDKYDVLFIVDEIATGFGHTGKMFAVEHASVIPDIMTIGKALSGGYMSFGAMVCTGKISDTISSNPPYALMHGPTFMGNALACAVSLASIELLLNSDWQAKVKNIEAHLSNELGELKSLNIVKDVRVIGCIGVVELTTSEFANTLQSEVVKQGVWLRPFGKLLYTIPAYIISQEELYSITNTMKSVIKKVDSERN